VPEENFWTLWCKGRLTEADTPTIKLGATPSGLTSAHLHHPPFYALPAAQSNSVKALKAMKYNTANMLFQILSAFGDTVRIMPCLESRKKLEFQNQWQ